MSASFDLTSGPLLVCSCLSFFWLGLVGHECVTYASRYPRDRLLFRLVVTVCVILSLIDTAFDASWAYDWLVTHYGDPEYMADVPFQFPAEMAMLGSTFFIVQNFYAYRIWRISERTNYIVPLLIIAMTSLQFGVALYLISFMFRHPTFVVVASGIFPTAWLWLAGLAAADVLVTGAMFWYLGRNTTHSPSHGLFRRILARSVQANVISLLSQILNFILFKATGAGFWYLIIDETAVKTLTWSLLMSLNARERGTSTMDTSYRPKANTFNLTTIDQRTQQGSFTPPEVPTNDVDRNRDPPTAVNVQFDDHRIEDDEDGKLSQIRHAR